jgi:replicative DNA helicase
MGTLEECARWTANLTEDDFYNGTHREIFRICQAMIERGETPIFTSVAEEYHALHGNYSDVAEVTGAIASIAHMGDVRGRLLRASRKRFLRAKLQQAMESLSEPNLERPVAILEGIVHEYGTRYVDEGTNLAKPIGDQCDEFGVLLEKVRAGEQGIAGRSTGYPRLDQLVAGLQGGRLYTVAARTGCGKTTFICNLAYQMAKDGSHCGFFSLEMGAQEIFQKFIAIESGVDMFRLRQGLVDPALLPRAVESSQRVARLPIFVNDWDKIGVSLIERDCTRLKEANRLDVIFVDYAQIVWTPPSRKSRYEVVGEITQGLKRLSRKLNVPVVMCAQLSRKSEDGEREPQLHHLRESGSIEMDSDSVWMLWRDGMTTKFKVAKQRNGPVGRLDFNFDAQKERFTEDNQGWTAPEKDKGLW